MATYKTRRTMILEHDMIESGMDLLSSTVLNWPHEVLADNFDIIASNIESLSSLLGLDYSTKGIKYFFPNYSIHGSGPYYVSNGMSLKEAIITLDRKIKEIRTKLYISSHEPPQGVPDRPPPDVPIVTPEIHWELTVDPINIIKKTILDGVGGTDAPPLSFGANLNNYADDTGKTFSPSLYSPKIWWVGYSDLVSSPIKEYPEHLIAFGHMKTNDYGTTINYSTDNNLYTAGWRDAKIIRYSFDGGITWVRAADCNIRYVYMYYKHWMKMGALIRGNQSASNVVYSFTGQTGGTVDYTSYIHELTFSNVWASKKLKSYETPNNPYRRQFLFFDGVCDSVPAEDGSVCYLYSWATKSFDSGDTEGYGLLDLFFLRSTDTLAAWNDCSYPTGTGKPVPVEVVSNWYNIHGINVLRLSNNDIIIVFGGKPTISDPYSIYLCRSEDNGATFSEPTSLFDTSISYIWRMVPSVIELDLNLSQPALALSYTTNEDSSTTNSYRIINALISEDAGNTWRRTVTIHGEEDSYLGSANALYCTGSKLLMMPNGNKYCFVEGLDKNGVRSLWRYTLYYYKK